MYSCSYNFTEQIPWILLCVWHQLIILAYWVSLLTRTGAGYIIVRVTQYEQHRIIVSKNFFMDMGTSVFFCQSYQRFRIASHLLCGAFVPIRLYFPRRHALFAAMRLRFAHLHAFSINLCLSTHADKYPCPVPSISQDNIYFTTTIYYIPHIHNDEMHYWAMFRHIHHHCRLSIPLL